MSAGTYLASTTEGAGSVDESISNAVGPISEIITSIAFYTVSIGGTRCR